jgi:hypothetical protein
MVVYVYVFFSPKIHNLMVFQYLCSKLGLNMPVLLYQDTSICFSSAPVLAANNWQSIVVGLAAASNAANLCSGYSYQENLLTLFQLCPSAGSEQLAVNSGTAGSSNISHLCYGYSYQQNLLTLFQLCPSAGSKKSAVNSGRAGSSK